MGLAARGFATVVAVPAALVAMQVPAATDAYRAWLAQSVREVRGMIDEHEKTVRDRYKIGGGDDAAVIEALRPVEPAHADALANDVAHLRGIETALVHVDAADPLLRPFAALSDLIADPSGALGAVWRTALGRFSPQVEFNAGGIAYGCGGLLLGGFAGLGAAGAGGRVFGRRARA